MFSLSITSVKSKPLYHTDLVPWPNFIVLTTKGKNDGGTSCSLKVLTPEFHLGSTQTQTGLPRKLVNLSYFLFLSSVRQERRTPSSSRLWMCVLGDLSSFITLRSTLFSETCARDTNVLWKRYQQRRDEVLKVVFRWLGRWERRVRWSFGRSDTHRWSLSHNSVARYGSETSGTLYGKGLR